MPAPRFLLHDSPTTRLGLDDFRGRWLVIVFYVADWDPVASLQLGRLTRLKPHLDRLGADVIGISVDSPWSHAAFAEHEAIAVPLLADDSPPGAVAGRFGLAKAGDGRSDRALFLVDGVGVVRWSCVVDRRIDPGPHDLLGALESLTGGPAHADGDAGCGCGCGLASHLTWGGGLPE
jgi:peroxiredoxin